MTNVVVEGMMTVVQKMFVRLYFLNKQDYLCSITGNMLQMKRYE